MNEFSEEDYEITTYLLVVRKYVLMLTDKLSDYLPQNDLLLSHG